MQAEETKMILRYFGGIEAQLDDVNIELAELRDRYNPIKGIAMDGMPHGSTPGDSTASLAVKLADDVECQRRENELRVRKDVLRADQTTIRGQLDRLNSRYKTILCGRYVYSDPSLQKGWKTIARELRKQRSQPSGGKSSRWSFWVPCWMKSRWSKNCSHARMTRAIKRGCKMAYA